MEDKSYLTNPVVSKDDPSKSYSKNINLQVPGVGGDGTGAIVSTERGEYVGRSLLPTPDSSFTGAITKQSPQRDVRHQPAIPGTLNIGSVSTQPFGVGNFAGQVTWPAPVGKKHIKVKNKPSTLPVPTKTHSTIASVWSTAEDTESRYPKIPSGQEKEQCSQHIQHPQYGPFGQPGQPGQPVQTGQPGQQPHFRHVQEEQYGPGSQLGQVTQRGQHIPHAQPVSQFGYYIQTGQHVPPVKTGQHVPHGQYSQHGPPSQYSQHSPSVRHGQSRQYGHFNQRPQPGQHGHGQFSMHGQQAIYSQQTPPVQQGQNIQHDHGQHGQKGQRGQHSQHEQHGQLVPIGQHSQYAQPRNFGHQGQQGQQGQYTPHTQQIAPHGRHGHHEQQIPIGPHGQYGPPGQFVQQDIHSTQIQYAQKNLSQLSAHNQNLQHAQQLSQLSRHQQFAQYLQFSQYVPPGQLTQHIQQQGSFDPLDQQGQCVQQFSHHEQQSQPQQTHHVQFAKNIQEEQRIQSMQQFPQVEQPPQQGQFIQFPQLGQDTQHSQRSQAELTQLQQPQKHLTQLSQYSQHEHITQNIQQQPQFVQISNFDQTAQIDQHLHKTVDAFGQQIQQTQQTQQTQQIQPAQVSLVQSDQYSRENQLVQHIPQLGQQDQNVEKNPSQHGQLIHQPQKTIPHFSQPNPEYQLVQHVHKSGQFPQIQSQPKNEFVQHIQKLSRLGEDTQQPFEDPMLPTRLHPDSQDDKMVRQIQKIGQLALDSSDELVESLGKNEFVQHIKKIGEEFDQQLEHSENFPDKSSQDDQFIQDLQKPDQLDLPVQSCEEFYPKHDTQVGQQCQESQLTTHSSIQDISKSKISYAEILRSDEPESKGHQNSKVLPVPNHEKPCKSSSTSKHPQQLQQEPPRLPTTKTDARIGFKPISHSMEASTSLRDVQLPSKQEQTSVSKSPFEIVTSFDDPPSAGEILQLRLNEMFGNNPGLHANQGAIKKYKKQSKAFKDSKNLATVDEPKSKAFNKELQIQNLLKLLNINETSINTLSHTSTTHSSSGFPTLTALQEAIITAATTVIGESETETESETDVLISKYGYKITRADIRTLKDDEWLNSQIINFYMSLIVERNTKQRPSQGMPKIYAMNSFFLENLMQSGFISVQRWTHEVDIFSYDAILMPLHYKGQQHWSLVVIHFKDLYIKIFDSMSYFNDQALEAVSEYLRAESQDKRHIPFDTRPFHTSITKNIPQQENGNDCGVFCCLYADYISRNKEVTFSSTNIKYFRRKITMEILQGELLRSS